MPLSTINYKNHIFCLSYKIYNLDKKINLIILHGWGSNKEIMQKSFALQENMKQYKLIFIDLPGFGKSDNKYVLTTNDYANILNIFFHKLDITSDIIIGHSFGGKVAALLNPRLLVLLSSAGIVPKKSCSVKMKIYIFKILKYIGFGFLYKIFASKDASEMSTNMYETFKNVVDEDFSEIFKMFSNKAIIFWGADDLQTPLKSGEIISSLIQHSTFIPLNGEHFFFASPENNSLIGSKINAYINKNPLI